MSISGSLSGSNRCFFLTTVSPAASFSPLFSRSNRFFLPEPYRSRRPPFPRPLPVLSLASSPPSLYLPCLLSPCLRVIRQPLTHIRNDLSSITCPPLSAPHLSAPACRPAALHGKKSWPLSSLFLFPALRAFLLPIPCPLSSPVATRLPVGRCLLFSTERRLHPSNL